MIVGNIILDWIMVPITVGFMVDIFIIVRGVRSHQKKQTVVDDHGTWGSPITSETPSDGLQDGVPVPQ